MRLKNKVIRVIRFWSDNSECSAQCGRSDNPEGRLTEGRTIEVLLYVKSAIHCLKVSGYIYSISILNNKFTKIEVNKKVHAGLETKMKN